MSSDSTDSAPDPDEVKRKFREALDRKNARSREGEAHLDGDSPVHAQQTPTTRREFRRKSG